jgi:hypothetical protein
MMMPGYPHPHHAHHPQHPQQAVDHGYANNPYLARGGYVPPPPPAAYYAMPGGPLGSGMSSGATSASHTPISSFGSTPASASANSSLRSHNGGGHGSEISAATSATQHASSAQQAGANSAYAQYLAAANAHQRKTSGSHPGMNGYENGHGPNGFTDASHAGNAPAAHYGAPGGGRRPHSNEDLAQGGDSKANDSLGIFGGATPPIGWRK